MPALAPLNLLQSHKQVFILMTIIKVQVAGRIINLGGKLNSLDLIQSVLKERFPQVFEHGVHLFFRDKQVNDFGSILRHVSQQKLQSIKLKAEAVQLKDTQELCLQSAIQICQNDNKIKMSCEKQNGDIIQIEDFKLDQNNLPKKQLQQSSISIVYSGFQKCPVKNKEDSVYEFDLNISEIERGNASQMYSSIDNSIQNQDLQASSKEQNILNHTKHSMMAPKNYKIKFDTNMVKTHSSTQGMIPSTILPGKLTKKQFSSQQQIHLKYSQRETQDNPSLRKSDSIMINNSSQMQDMQIIDEDLQLSGGFQVQLQRNQSKKGGKFMQGQSIKVSKQEQGLIDELVKQRKKYQYNPQKKIDKQAFDCFKCSQIVEIQNKNKQKCDLCGGKGSLGRNHPYIKLLTTIIEQKIRQLHI